MKDYSYAKIAWNEEQQRENKKKTLILMPKTWILWQKKNLKFIDNWSRAKKILKLRDGNIEIKFQFAEN